MTPKEWEKLKKHMPVGRDKIRRTTCPICGGEITEDDSGEGLTYSKTGKGSHVFIHESCLFPKGGKHAKQ
jgi:hypothetical protein